MPERYTIISVSQPTIGRFKLGDCTLLILPCLTLTTFFDE